MVSLGTGDECSSVGLELCKGERTVSFGSNVVCKSNFTLFQKQTQTLVLFFCRILAFDIQGICIDGLRTSQRASKYLKYIQFLFHSFLFLEFQSIHPHILTQQAVSADPWRDGSLKKGDERENRAQFLDFLNSNIWTVSVPYIAM